MTVVMNLATLLGGMMIILPTFDLMQVVETIHKKRPTLFIAVPTIFTAINHCKKIEEYDLHSIGLCVSGGAPLPVETKRNFERLTGCKLVEGYGLSESSPVATMNPYDGEIKIASIGLPVPRTIMEVVSLDDRKTVMPIGERGEVCITGPQIMTGYWNQPEETAYALEQTPNGARLHTGDIGYMGDDGFTYIVDRLKDMILTGGFNVYPRNVEEAIYKHPKVEECVVVGLPDEFRGQIVKAFVKLRSEQTMTASEMKAFLEDKLGPVEIPKFVEFRDLLPKTTVGKLSRKMMLEEELAKQHARG
jgi:long-chain acyl-CoA synthetase